MSPDQLPNTPLTVQISIEHWPLRDAFVISRGAKSQAVVVVVELSDGIHAGRGECVPYPRYGETPEDTSATIKSVIGGNPLLDRQTLQQAMPPGAARNAIDCALWGLEAARAQKSVAQLLGLQHTGQLLTCRTISLDRPDAMADEASRHVKFPLLKLKLGADAPAECMTAVRRARPDARIVVDANEGWQPEFLPEILEAAAAARIETIEQPLPVGHDELLAALPHLVPICADESAHTTDGLATLLDRYDAVNIKLDKTGGLTEALRMAERARELGLKIMVGCMVSTSMSMAPAFHLASHADWLDLDGPLLLAHDRTPGLRFDGPWIAEIDPRAWA